MPESDGRAGQGFAPLSSDEELLQAQLQVNRSGRPPAMELSTESLNVDRLARYLVVGVDPRLGSALQLLDRLFGRGERCRTLILRCTAGFTSA